MEERSRLWQIAELAGPVSGMVATTLAVLLVVPLLRNAAAETEVALPGIIQAFLDHGVWIATAALALGAVTIVIIRKSPRRWVGLTCSLLCTVAMFVPLLLFVWGFWALYVAMLDDASRL